MAPTSNTVAMLQDCLVDSDTWGDAEPIVTAEGTQLPGSGQNGPIDENNTSLDMESSFLMRTGREPSNEEIMEYLEKHQLQSFLTDVVMYLARHFPPDPFEFLLNHIEAMVMKHRSSSGYLATDTKLASKLPPVAQPAPPQVSDEQREKIVRRLVAVLQHDGISSSSAVKVYQQFAGNPDKMTQDNFSKLLAHFEKDWGLQSDDTKVMSEVLKRWRFRANAANGTRGMPLWPLTQEDFVKAYPSMLRSVRDRYVPIGGQVHRSMFIRESAGILTDKYDVGPKLGQGAFGEVLLVSLKANKERRVCKRVAKTQQKVPNEEFFGEIDVLRGMDHPHIIRLFEYFNTEDDFTEMIMEPVFGGTLTHVAQGLFFDTSGRHLGKRPESLTEGWLAKVFSQLLSALEYAHEVAGVVHKDLKPDNVLMVGPSKISVEELLKQPVHGVLADFGIAEVFAPTTPLVFTMSGGDESSFDEKNGTFGTGFMGARRSQRVGGTPSYMSREMFKRSFTEKSDVWSLGVMLFQMMTGDLPYKGDNLLMQAHMVCNPRRHPPWDLLSKYKWSLGARWLCQQLLAKDEGMRPSSSQAMKDTWLTKASTSHNVEPATSAERMALHRQHVESHMEKMALSCITSQLSLSQLHHLNLRFQFYDRSGDGRLSDVEVRQVFKDVGVTADEDIELLIESLDSDHSGLIEYSEFVAGCLDIASDGMKNQLKVAFNVFDLDGSGKITLDELRQVLTQGANTEVVPVRPTTSSGKSGPLTAGHPLHILPDGKTVEEVMKELDSYHSNKVDEREFEAYLLAAHKKAGEELNAKQKK